jgi:sterol desaturase/sphingolipid hydroxylase (fatty acid hydroxylase superfamily)
MLKGVLTLSVTMVLLLVENSKPFFSYQKRPNIKNIVFNSGVGIFNYLITFVTISVGFLWVFEHPFEDSLFSLLTLPGWAQLIIAFLVLDLYIYWWHRLMHTRIGWWAHRFHHRDKQMSVTTAYRFNIIEVVISNLPRIAIVFFMGIPLEYFLVYEIVFTSLNLIQHSNIQLPKQVESMLNPIIVTPNLHKVHHSNIVEETNSNFGTVFSFWDSIFNSRKVRQPSTYKDIVFGT